MVSISIGANPARASDCYACDFGTSAWSLVSGPKLAPLGGLLVATYVNNVPIHDTGWVYSVVRNMVGQTVGYETTTLNLDAGQSGDAYLFVYVGLAQGNYTVSVFVTSPAGTAISSTVSVNYVR